MKNELNIIIACGSGVATSTIAMEKVKVILKEAGIQAKLHKCSLGEIAGKQKDMDLILTTANYRKPLEVPQMSVFGLVSGIGADAVKTKLVDKCKEIMAQ